MSVVLGEAEVIFTRRPFVSHLKDPCFRRLGVVVNSKIPSPELSQFLGYYAT